MAHAKPNVTLDRNCLIALEEGSDYVDQIHKLISLSNKGDINLRVVAVSASEKQATGKYLQSFSVFEQWLRELGLSESEVLPALGYTDITFWDRSVWGGTCCTILEREIHEILFGGTDIGYSLDEHMKPFVNAGQKDLDKQWDRWLNAKCDTLTFWSHAVNGAGTFVSDDKNFSKATKKGELLRLSGGEILRPQEVATQFSPGATIQTGTLDLKAFVQIPDDQIDLEAVPAEFKHYWAQRSS